MQLYNFLRIGVPMRNLFTASSRGRGAVVPSSLMCRCLKLVEFSEPGIFNYSTLLLSEDKDVLYVGAREAIFELRMTNVSIKNNKVQWKVPENHMTMCIVKGKSKETDCLNYIRVLQVLDDKRLYVCGTHAFQPVCHYLSLKDFSLEGPAEDGRGKCSFDPSQSFTTVMVDGELYSGTSYNFLGSEPIISRYSLSQSLLRTEYSTSWLNEPSFVFADVIREGKNSADGEDDKIYYFFTEVSVEYEFFGKLLIPRIARVCKGDLGGQRTLQKKWTSFLKAKLVCSMPELNFVFNVVTDVFILKTADWRETVIYGVFTSQGNVGLSAVCAYDMLSVENVFSKGKYMQKATVEQSHTKWVRYNGITPTPRPGACINNHHRLQNISSSLHLPDKTLQFVKDHPLLEDPVLPIGNGPKLITKDVSYTQIAVERVQALDNNVYDVIFTGTDKGLLHKSVVYDGLVHTVEEIQLLHKSEPIKTLLLSSQGARSLYAGSDSGVVQSPTAFCDKYPSCSDCILTRDPYCAWDPDSSTCVNIFHTQELSFLSFGSPHLLPLSLTAASSAVPPLSPVDTSSSLSTSGSSPSLPPSSTSSERLGVCLLPPSLQDQAWGVQAQEAFLLFCLALGPSDLQIHWQVNGAHLETPITEYRHPLVRGDPHGEVLVSSWVRERALVKDSSYQCVAASSAGNDTSKVDLNILSRDEDSIPSRDMSQWRSALSEHDKLLKRWKRAWVGLYSLSTKSLGK
uniref:Semaphorin 4D n=1 Tax=Oncorhynchus tshawytscha TaxID=74940 RepID=A0A8C8CZ28_ONCTS